MSKNTQKVGVYMEENKIVISEIGDVASIDVKDNKYLSFLVNKQKYALSAMQVMQILKDIEYTVLPLVEPYVKGIIELREEVIPIIDLRLRLNVEIEKETNCVIITQLVDKKIGIVVDEVSEVFLFEEAKYDESRTITQDNKFVKGLYKNGNEIIMLLNTDHLME